jgi:Rps23 Pro-64 3,4-dihydroxylase Tpa1-like proline 4-hydroxylase
MNASIDPVPLEIAPELPETELRARFEQEGRLHVAGVLTEAAARRIHQHLLAQQDWDLVFRHAGRHRDMNYRDLGEWSRADRDRFDELVAEEARAGFQYCFANVPIYDVWHRRMLPGHFFEELFEFLNSPAWLDLVRRLTGADDIGFTDAQATRYAPGHFLTRHDDDVAGKQRRIAYVLNLTPQWQPDWGGTLRQAIWSEASIRPGTRSTCSASRSPMPSPAWRRSHRPIATRSRAGAGPEPTPARTDSKSRNEAL